MSPANAQRLRPADEAQAAAFVLDARKQKLRLEIVGGGTRRGLGRPFYGDAELSSQALNGIDFYEPAEMVIGAKAGTPLSVIEAAIAAHGQILPFEPMDARSLYRWVGEPTLGGLIGGNISGPRRISAGAARDCVLGLRLVNGRGQIIKTGGRVMKNVTGLDLVRLNCGAMGTLGFITQAIVKLAPKPEAEATVVIRRLDDAKAVAAMAIALGSPWSLSGAAHLSAGMGRDFPRSFFRLEGFADSVAARRDKLIEALKDFGAKHAVEGDASARLWRAIRDVEFLSEPKERAIWRISVAPSNGPKLIAALGPMALAHFYDWGGGLIWLAAAPTPEVAGAIRAALVPLGGQATLMRAQDSLRERVEVYQPLSPALLEISRGIKASFDPDGVLNAGRMYAEF